MNFSLNFYSKSTSFMSVAGTRQADGGGYHPKHPGIGGQAPEKSRILHYYFDTALAFWRVTAIMSAE